MDLQKEIMELIAGILEVPASELSEDTAIGDIPIWDSLHQVQIISEIEEKYDFNFDVETMMDLEDINDIIAAVEERISK